MFRIPTQDPATPSFVSACINLYADAEEARHMLDVRRQSLPREMTTRDELCRVIERLLSGHDEVTASVMSVAQKAAYIGEPMSRKTLRMDRINRTYENVWDLPYEIRLEGIRLDMAWLEDEDVPMRVTRISAQSMTIDRRSVRVAWGEAGVTELKEGHVNTTVHLPDIEFGSISEMKADISNPTTDPSVSHAMDALIGQIVADG